MIRHISGSATPSTMPSHALTPQRSDRRKDDQTATSLQQRQVCPPTHDCFGSVPTGTSPWIRHLRDCCSRARQGRKRRKARDRLSTVLDNDRRLRRERLAANHGVERHRDRWSAGYAAWSHDHGTSKWPTSASRSPPARSTVSSSCVAPSRWRGSDDSTGHRGRSTSDPGGAR